MYPPPAHIVAAPVASAQPSLPAAARAGALFSLRASTFHSCSGVVLHSTGRNLVATAAHCIVGTGSTMAFAPGYAGGRAPFGRWQVRAAWVDRRWRERLNSRADLAILAVRPQHRNGQLMQLEDVVPGAHLAAGAPAAGTPIEAVGYPAGSSGAAVDCATSVTLTGPWPTFACAGFVGGTSGGPWLSQTPAGLTVSGVIGGLHQGGCLPQVSYAAPLGAWSAALLARAERHPRGDFVPIPPTDGC